MIRLPCSYSHSSLSQSRHSVRRQGLDDLLSLYADASPRVRTRLLDLDRSPGAAQQLGVRTYNTAVAGLYRSRGLSTDTAVEAGFLVATGLGILKALEPGWITKRQIEAARVALTRLMKREGKVWIRIFPDKPVTKKAAETRMGSGKGAPDHWVAVVRPGRILFEMAGVPPGRVSYLDALSV